MLFSTLGKDNALAIALPGKPRPPLSLWKEYYPLGFGASGHARGGLVFAGFGVAASLGAVKLDPKQSSAYNNLCYCRLMMKSYDEAISACQNALAIRPDFERGRDGNTPR